VEILIFWLALSVFSTGFCEDNTRGLKGLVITLAYLIFWPLLLGCHLREITLKDKDA